MIKKLAPFLKKYKLFALLAPATVIIEVLLEIRIPFLMAEIVDVAIPAKDIGHVMRTGGAMILMALLALVCGALSGRFAARASMGFGSEIRNSLFQKVQEFSFANVDRFSTASLVTRLTTDVNNAQMACMMVVRVLVRAPVMLISATFMAFSINASLVTVFLVAIPVLAIALGTIATCTYPRFKAMLKKYDSMNASVQENLIAIRVVKAFALSLIHIFISFSLCSISPFSSPASTSIRISSSVTCPSSSFPEEPKARSKRWVIPSSSRMMG